MTKTFTVNETYDSVEFVDKLPKSRDVKTDQMIFPIVHIN